MSRVGVHAIWAYRGQNRRAERDRLLQFVEALRPIHPLLHDFSWTGKHSGWKPMLEQPELRDLTGAQWETVLKEPSAILVRRFWNRRQADEEAAFIDLDIFDPPSDYPHLRDSSIRLCALPDPLAIGPTLDAMMAAAITAWQPDFSTVGTLFHVEPRLDTTAVSATELAIIRQRAGDIRRPDRAEWWERAKQFDGGIDTPVWRLWLASGQPWPKPGSTWLEPWQSEPPDEEALWQGGMRYTWHKYAPWNLPDEADWKR